MRESKSTQPVRHVGTTARCEWPIREDGKIVRFCGRHPGWLVRKPRTLPLCDEHAEAFRRGEWP